MNANTLEIRTVQATAFKILVEALKELLTDTCIDFDETGMKIVSMDNSHIVLVHLKLDAPKFEYFHCESKITIGVNMLNLYKLIRTINSNDTLTLFIESDDLNHLGIKIENGEKNTKTTYKLNLLDLDNPKISVNPADFNYEIMLQSADFQKICRDMSNIAEVVEIKNVGNQLILSCKGDFCSQETVLADTENNSGSKNNNEIVQGIFNLKYLVLFTKCTNLCSTVELFLKNDYPLLIRYMVASLGEVKLCLAPQSQNHV
jgi:proliferating cell nuclear antigen|uniref:Proliferating cell nuclear antigen PCNA N-terminal domain-containing protein n=1 Tax=viral metagenome TaxID=1070528 RepID=A0A6C0BET2_9ZZZZ